MASQRGSFVLVAELLTVVLDGRAFLPIVSRPGEPRSIAVPEAGVTCDSHRHGGRENAHDRKECVNTSHFPYLR
jgi:hypothetical protein